MLLNWNGNFFEFQSQGNEVNFRDHRNNFKFWCDMNEDEQNKVEKNQFITTRTRNVFGIGTNYFLYLRQRMCL